MKNNKTRFSYVLYCHRDKTWVFDQSERALLPIYIIMKYMHLKSAHSARFVYLSMWSDNWLY